ncbi:DUF86 domain-containing protein [Saprospiraceae bacterium]|nr:DUF86 domain-containing protein [Saprospiraceae bacterium]
MSSKDIANLKSIKDSISKIYTFIEDVNNANEFYNDSKTFDAVLMNFINIGEAVVRLNIDITNSYSKIPWSKVKSFRNILVHNYFGVDAEEVWEIIHKDLDSLMKVVESILAKS